MFLQQSLSKSSNLRVKGLANRVLKGIPFPKLVVVMLGLVPLLKMHVVIRKEVIVILRADDFVLQFLLDVSIRVEEGGLVLPQLVVVVFIVEVVRGEMGSLGGWVAELLQHLLETCSRLGSLALVERRVGIDIEDLDLLGDVVHGFLKVAAFSVGRKIQWLEGRESPHQFFVTQRPLVLGSNFPADGLELLPREIYSQLMDEIDEHLNANRPTMLLVNMAEDGVEGKPVDLDELLPKLLNGSVVLDLFLE